MFENLLLAMVIELIVIYLGLNLEYETPWFARLKKEIAYEIIRYELVTEQLRKEMMAHWTDCEIMTLPKRLVIATIKIANTGKTEILPTDYASPIIVSVDDGSLLKSTILCSPQVIEKSNRMLSPVFSPIDSDFNTSTWGTNRLFRIEPLLLNQQDYFIFTVLLSRIKIISLEAHIAGIRRLKKIKKPKPSTMVKRTIALGIIFAIPTFLLMNWLQQEYPVFSQYVTYFLQGMCAISLISSIFVILKFGGNRASQVSVNDDN